MSTTTSPPAAEFDPEVSHTLPATGAGAPAPPRARRVIIGAPSPPELAAPSAEPAPDPPKVRRVIIGAPAAAEPEATVPAAPVADIARPASIVARHDRGQLVRRIG